MKLAMSPTGPASAPLALNDVTTRKRHPPRASPQTGFLRCAKSGAGNALS